MQPLQQLPCHNPPNNSTQLLQQLLCSNPPNNSTQLLQQLPCYNPPNNSTQLLQQLPSHNPPNNSMQLLQQLPCHNPLNNLMQLLQQLQCNCCTLDPELANLLKGFAPTTLHLEGADHREHQMLQHLPTSVWGVRSSAPTEVYPSQSGILSSYPDRKSVREKTGVATSARNSRNPSLVR
jgi:hypothetical protein